MNSFARLALSLARCSPPLSAANRPSHASTAGALMTRGSIIKLHRTCSEAFTSFSGYASFGGLKISCPISAVILGLDIPRVACATTFASPLSSRSGEDNTFGITGFLRWSKSCLRPRPRFKELFQGHPLHTIFVVRNYFCTR